VSLLSVSLTHVMSGATVIGANRQVKTVSDVRLSQFGSTHSHASRQTY
jgi:hypothetical protein